MLASASCANRADPQSMKPGDRMDDAALRLFDVSQGNGKEARFRRASYLSSLAGPHTPPDAGTIGRRNPPNARMMQVGGAIVGTVNVGVSIIISVGRGPANIRVSETEPTVSCISHRRSC